VEPLSNHNGGLRLTVVGRPSKIVAFGNKWFMLNETIIMVPIFKIIFPTSTLKIKQTVKNYDDQYILHSYRRQTSYPKT
jgi:hypothetical protein